MTMLRDQVAMFKLCGDKVNNDKSEQRVKLWSLSYNLFRLRVMFWMAVSSLTSHLVYSQLIYIWSTLINKGFPTEKNENII